jgi:hypothetical protein
MSAMRRLALVVCTSAALIFALATGSAFAVDRTISGTVTEQGAPGPAPLEHVCVEAWTVGSRVVREQVDTATTDSTGHYALAVPEGGSYKLDFHDCGTDDGDYVEEWANNKASYNVADTINVGASGATVDAALAHGGSISGTVTNAAAPGLPLEHICATALEESSGQELGSDETDAAGHYEIPGLWPRRYKVRFGECGTGNAMTEFYNDRTGQSSGDAVTVIANADTGGIDAQLQQGGSITGHVTKASDGTNMSGVCVNATSTSPGIPGTSTATTSASGTYTLRGLRTGSYKIRFGCANPYLTQWFDNKPTEAAADPVSVTIGANTPNVDAAMVRGGTITGHVDKAAGGNVTLGCATAFPVGGGGGHGAFTDGSGNYTITGLPSGSYKVRFDRCSAAGSLLPQWYNGKATEAAADPVDVLAENTTPNVNATLATGGTISGSVTRSGSATTVPFAAVTAIPTGGGDPFEVTADGSGNYSVRDLPAGDYKLHFDGTNQGYNDIWFDQKASEAAADPVTVGAGASVTGRNAQLTQLPSTTAFITGHVRDSASHASLEDGVCVTAFDAAGNVVDQAFSHLDGRFTIGVPAGGGYRLRFVDCGTGRDYPDAWWQNKTSLATADPVTAPAAGNTSDLGEVDMVEGGRVGVHVQDQDGNPLGGICVSVVRADGTVLNFDQTPSDGDLEIAGLPAGSGYHVHVANCAGGNLVPVDVPLGAVTSGGLIGPVTATMPRGYRIFGHVDGPSGSLGDDACVSATVPSHPEVGTLEDGTDDYGNYTIEGVPLGAAASVTATDCTDGELDDSTRTVVAGTTADQRVGPIDFTLAFPPPPPPSPSGDGGTSPGNGGNTVNTTNTGNQGNTNTGNQAHAAGSLTGGGTKTAAKNGTFTVASVSCAGPADCSATGNGSGALAKVAIAKKRKKVMLASGKATIKAGRKGALKLKLTKKARKALAKKGRLKMRVTVTLSSPGATAVRKTFAVTVKPAKKKK